MRVVVAENDQEYDRARQVRTMGGKAHRPIQGTLRRDVTDA